MKWADVNMVHSRGKKQNKVVHFKGNIFVRVLQV